MSRVVLSLLLLMPASAAAIEVAIDPGDYPGQYALQGAWVSGAQTADFDVGTHSVNLGAFNDLSFEVAADGTVTPADSAQAVGGVGSLAFTTHTVTIDNDTCDGRWSLHRVVGFQTTSSGDVALVPGGYFGNSGSFAGYLFDVEADGSVTVDGSYSDQASAQGSTVTHNCLPVTYDIGTYTERYGSPWTNSGWASADTTVDLMPGIQLVYLGAYHSFSYTLEADGTVSYRSEQDASDTVSLSGSTVSFLNHDIVVDAQDADGRWSVWLGSGWRTGDSTLSLPAGDWAIYTSPYDRFDLTVSTDGTVSVDSAVAQATATDSTLTFVTELVTIEPELDYRAWRATYSDNVWAGTQTVALVVGTHSLSARNTEASKYTLSSPCALDKSVVYDGGNYAHTLSCADTGDTGDTGLMDSDGDGVPDDQDLCDGFDDTLDADEDGVPDDCDLCEGDDATGNLDSDGWCDDEDNCPLDANASQADSDGDGLGDTCETDGDGDGVIDDDDNCPEDANIDQADNELDGIGDVCDVDDDDDGVIDELDVCPLLADADQTDTDGDGQGDVCDGDDDGDAIDDADDLCPGTPLTMAIDADGCSGTQRVDLTCGTSCDHHNHGQYQSCVTQTSRDAVDAGLLSNKERASVVRTAAKSSCEE